MLHLQSGPIEVACRGLGGLVATTRDVTTDAKTFPYRAALRLPDVLASGVEIDRVQTEEIHAGQISGK